MCNYIIKVSMELIITDVTASCICWFDLGIKGEWGISAEISE